MRQLTSHNISRLISLTSALCCLVCLATACIEDRADAPDPLPGHTTTSNNTTGQPNNTTGMTTGNNTTGAAETDAEIQALLSTLPTPQLPASPPSFSAELPAHFRTATVQRFDNTPADNPITDAGAQLGRVLFYDKLLSKNGTVACASCHKADNGFSDALVKSRGFDGGDTRRHSMPIVNLRYYPRQRMFWDERAATLEEQVLKPIQDEVEMGLTLAQLEARVAAAPYYRELFRQAFGDEAVSSDRISRALAQFLRAIVSYDSKWDRAVATSTDISGDLSGFTAQENRGKEIFFGQHDPNTRGLCGTCHLRDNPLAFAPGPGGPTRDNLAIFYTANPSNNGLLDETDDGVAESSANPADVGAFKSPSLRNIELRAPYMHDGRFATLDEVVEHYNSGVQAHPNLDPALRTGGPGAGGAQPIRLNLSTADKAALVAFLKTFTDRTVTTDPRFQSPF